MQPSQMPDGLLEVRLRANLATTRSCLKWPSLELLKIWEAKKAMLEIPFLDEIIIEKTRENTHQNIAAVLEARFGNVSRSGRGHRVGRQRKTTEKHCAIGRRCPTRAAFRRAMTPD